MRRQHKNHRFNKNHDKIKISYATYTHRYWWSWKQEYIDSELFVVCGYLRHIKTTNERRQNAAHADEYGPELVRGKRRGRNLPDAWEDISLNTWGQRKCWKHNSKRRKQYKS